MTTATATGGLSRLEPQPNRHHPAWLSQARRAGFEWVNEHGFPTLKDEDWRYTRLGPILDVAFQPAPALAAGRPRQIPAGALNAASTDLGGAQLVFVNGHFAAELSSLTKLPEGVTVTSLSQVLADEAGRLEPLFSRPIRDQHAFIALNGALAEDGAFVQLAPGTTVDEPIHLVFFSDTAGSPLVSSPRSVILAGPDSTAVIVETYLGVAGDLYCTNAVTEIVLEEGSMVEHYKVQNEAETAFHLALLDVRQGRRSRFSSHLVALGSSIGRHEVRVGLHGEGAEVSLDGLYMPRGDQHHDNPILIEHGAPHCTSRQLYKGVLDGRGHGVFNGRVVVRPGAYGTDAGQTNKNLLLSDHAEVDSRPRLEIFADDVKCAHGAAIGRLDDDAVFYLRSRGIALREARGLLTYAFANEMVERIHIEALRSSVETLVTNRLHGPDRQVET